LRPRHSGLSLLWLAAPGRSINASACVGTRSPRQAHAGPAATRVVAATVSGGLWPSRRETFQRCALQPRQFARAGIACALHCGLHLTHWARPEALDHQSSSTPDFRTIAAQRSIRSSHKRQSGVDPGNGSSAAGHAGGRHLQRSQPTGQTGDRRSARRQHGSSQQGIFFGSANPVREPHWPRLRHIKGHRSPIRPLWRRNSSQYRLNQYATLMGYFRDTAISEPHPAPFVGRNGRILLIHLALARAHSQGHQTCEE